MDRLVRSRRNLSHEMLIAEDATQESSAFRAFGIMFSYFAEAISHKRCFSGAIKI